MTTSTRMAALFAALAVLVLPATAGLAYPLKGGDLQIGGGTAGESTTISTGDSITISGGGFAAGATVTVTIESEPMVLGSTKADARGDISATVAIPQGFPAGSHTIKATGDEPDGGTMVLAQPVTVTGGVVQGDPTADRGRDGLANTGSDGAALFAIAGLLVVGGAGALIFSRRHSEQA